MLQKTFADAADSYVRHGGEGKYLPKIVEKIGAVALGEIVPPQIVELAKTLFPHQTNSSRNRMVITPVSAVLSHAHQLGWAPVIKLRRFKVEAPQRKQAASQLWIHAFVRQCDLDGLAHLADLVLFMSQTGARVSEAIEVRWSDVDLAKKKALLRKVKNDKNSVRFLTDELANRLHNRQRGNSAAGRVFDYTNRHSVNERIEAVCRRAGITYKPTHTCGRHAMANNAMALGVDIKSTMIAGGWKSTAVFLETYVNPQTQLG